MCEFDNEYNDLLSEIIQKGEIPYEYYILSWRTYANHIYSLSNRPLSNICINTSTMDANSSFNYFNKSLFLNKYSIEDQIRIKNEFRSRVDNLLTRIDVLTPIDENMEFGINNKKVIFESVLSIYADSILLENRGSGLSSLIKTKIALDKDDNHSDVILIEEPENHLDPSSLKQMLSEIQRRCDMNQIIITTHSSVIASKLNLNNIIWIKNDNTTTSLNNVDKDTAKFFIKADNDNLLKMLLAEKLVLVEGATESLLLPELYKCLTGHSLEEDRIVIISCQGIAYSRYLSILKNTNKKVLVLTDNDGNCNKIDMACATNEKNKFQKICMDMDPKNWTWETCFYNLNTQFLKEVIHIDSDAAYLYNNKEYEKTLGKMLNNKVECAYQLLSCVDKLSIPQYIKDGLKWLAE